MLFDPPRWKPASDIPREFVKHINPEPSPASLFQVNPTSGIVTLSIIVPTSDADRDGRFVRLLEQVRNQNLADYELIIVRGDQRQGRAINTGAEISKGKYMLTLDDDTSLPNPESIGRLISVLDTHPDIGIAGGNNVVPEAASFFVRRVMQEIPRRSWKPVQTITDSDLAEHPCMIMRTEEFKAIGGENELIPRGLDPYLRKQYRKLGKRVVIVPGVIYHHLPPATLTKLVRQFYRNGRQAAYTNRNYPEWVIETPSEHGSFQSTVSFRFRLIRFPIRLLKALVTGKPIWMLSEIAYGFGYICEMIKSGNTKKTSYVN